jgi:hypothetical protein
MRILRALLMVFAVNLCFASTLDGWNDTVTYEGSGYAFSVPRSWRYRQSLPPLPEHSFEASGLALPATHKGDPVIVTAFITRFPTTSLTEAEDNTIEGYGQNPDRVFPVGEKPGRKAFKLSSGQPAKLLNTRFYRKSKNLQQSRFDLVAFMPRHKQALLYTLSVQYVDETYQLEQKLKLAELAEKMFAAVRLDP